MMKTKRTQFGMMPTAIVAALVCAAGPRGGRAETAEGGSAETGGGSKNDTPTPPNVILIDGKELDEARVRSLLAKEGDLAELMASEPTSIKVDGRPLSIDGARALIAGQNLLAETIQELFNDRIKDNETPFSIADALLREYAENVQGKGAATELVEGCSAIHRGPAVDGKPGTGVRSIYVLGVSVERKEVCIASNPPKLLPLDECEAVKRGHKIADFERKQRDDQFPNRTWDKRED